MRILYIILHKYLRLSLSDIETFEMDCTNPEQVIIGTNGSGKSSIMQELTPIPAHKRNFSKGGYKTIYIRHNHSLYKLVSDFKAGNNHEFWVANDDVDHLAAVYENLNPGRTYKVQLSLVEEHFGFTPDIVDLFVSKEKFTNMSVSRRKEWIIRLSGGDLDYVIGLHRKLVKRSSESQTVVKHIRKRIGEESSKLISPEELSLLKDKAEEYNNTLTKLYNSGIERTNYNLDDINNRIKISLGTIEKFTKHVTGMKLSAPRIDGEQISNIEELKSWKHTLTDRERDYQAKLSKLYQESSELTQMVKRLTDSKDINIEDLQKTNDELNYQINELIPTLKCGVYVNIFSDSALALYDKLIEISMSMLDNSNRSYTRETASQVKDHRKSLSDRYIIANRELEKYKHRLEHIENAKHEECPSCNHKWYPGIEQGSKEHTLAQITHLEKTMNDLDREMFEADEYLGLYSEFATSANTLNALFQSNPAFQSFWDMLLANDLWYMHPNTLQKHIQEWYTDVSKSFTIHSWRNTISMNSNVIYEYERNKGNDIDKTQGMLSDLEANINRHIHLIEGNKLKLEELNRFESHHETIRLNYEYALKETRELSKQTAIYLEQLATNIVKEEVQDNQLKLANTQTALQAAMSIQVIIDSLEANLNEANKQLTRREDLAKALDPKVGLIADYIRSFIDLFVEQMNDIIAKVWTVPMQIMPCGFNDSGADAGDLNYRFPVSHNTGLTVSQDIADNSSAQKDMIDFAFVLTVYLYLGYKSYPLYIDELAPTMDELHRININNFVKMLIESHRHSQMFMISHYMSGYGIFQNADICMLSDINIVNKPERYNSHVIIK